MPLTGQDQVADLHRPSCRIERRHDDVEHRGIRRDLEQQGFVPDGMAGGDLLRGVIEPDLLPRLEMVADALAQQIR